MLAITYPRSEVTVLSSKTVAERGNLSLGVEASADVRHDRQPDQERGQDDEDA